MGKVLLKKVFDDGYQIKPKKLKEVRNIVDLIQGNIFEANKIEETVSGTE